MKKKLKKTLKVKSKKKSGRKLKKNSQKQPKKNLKTKLAKKIQILTDELTKTLQLLQKSTTIGELHGSPIKMTRKLKKVTKKGRAQVFGILKGKFPICIFQQCSATKLFAQIFCFLPKNQIITKFDF